MSHLIFRLLVEPSLRLVRSDGPLAQPRQQHEDTKPDDDDGERAEHEAGVHGDDDEGTDERHGVEDVDEGGEDETVEMAAEGGPDRRHQGDDGGRHGDVVEGFLRHGPHHHHPPVEAQAAAGHNKDNNA